MKVNRVVKTWKNLIKFGDIQIGYWFTGISEDASLCQKLNNNDDGANFINWDTKKLCRCPSLEQVVEAEVRLVEWCEK